MSEFRGPTLTLDLYSLYILASNASMILDTKKHEEVMKVFGCVLHDKFGVSKKDIRTIEEVFDIEASDDEDDEEDDTTNQCCVCSNELYFGAEVSSWGGECTECHQVICESRTCLQLSADDDLYCLTCWKSREVNGNAEIGDCGFRCDGHCQTCDPGYPHGGRYDGADEI